MAQCHIFFIVFRYLPTPHITSSHRLFKKLKKHNRFPYVFISNIILHANSNFFLKINKTQWLGPQPRTARFFHLEALRSGVHTPSCASRPSTGFEPPGIRTWAALDQLHRKQRRYPLAHQTIAQLPLTNKRYHVAQYHLTVRFQHHCLQFLQQFLHADFSSLFFHIFIEIIRFSLQTPNSGKLHTLPKLLWCSHTVQTYEI